MKKVLGLDLGTNSIGWALVNNDFAGKEGEIVAAGSRIIPMSQEILGDFNKGNSVSQTASRTGFRGTRRLRERHLLRRERLHRVLNILKFLPEHYAKKIDFDKRFGQFLPETEPKLAWTFNVQTNKAEFLFKKSFKEMTTEFAKCQPQLFEGEKKIAYDWTIYYLRKKALTDKIEKEELAWLLLNFNQKRGYHQLRGEDDVETPSKLVEFYSLRITNVINSGDKKGKDEIWYDVHLENGWIYRRTSKIPLDWIGKLKDFIVTTDLNDDGSVKKDKEGKEKRSFRAPAEDDWTLLKKKSESDIEKANKTVGTYIYDTLLKNPSQKINGKLVRVIERKFYKEELNAILKKQIEFHDELKDKNLYDACLEELYENNEAHRTSIINKDFAHLFLNDIIFYQRPLKSKKSLISNCKFESRTFIKDGVKRTDPLKGIAKSHPLFQEFRLWQFIQNLKLFRKQPTGDVEVTNQFLQSQDDFVKLYEWLNERKDIEQQLLLKQYFKIKNTDELRWNYVEDKTYPCNETRALITSRLNKIKNLSIDFLNKENEEALWHILYSVEDKSDIQKALKTFAGKHGLEEDFVDQLKKFPPFKKEYSSFSAKAIKKLLPLMRTGRCWSEKNIHPQTKERIDKIITGEYDQTIRDRVREKSINLTTFYHFQGLPVWLVSYIVYDRHSEDGEALKWKKPSDIENYLKNVFKQHTLRNPIVEQVITETLRVVKDVWETYGKGEENFFDEMHIELGREMKNPADKRLQMSKQMNENENTNLRVKALLAELFNDNNYENVRPYSPMQQEILKIYEEGVLNAANEMPEDISRISKQAQPTQAELIRYKLWMQQGYRSPYTGKVIPLNKLFTRAYDIEHIIPQSRFFDDSFSNKIICEVEVNIDKDKSTAYEYIKNNSGKKIELSHGKTISLLTIEVYEDFVKKNYLNSKGKRNRLLMENIPEAFIQRQMNDSRYISKVVKNLMSNIVRENNEQEVISKNVIAGNGSITSILKQDWGLNDVWNEIITPRFARLNELTGSQDFGEWTNKGGKKIFQTQVPIQWQKGFSKKRIDHRHHALDAIVIACATRSHINYLNNDNANGKDKNKPTRFDLRNKLRRLEDIQIERFENGKKVKKIIKVGKEFKKPWETFTQEAKEILNKMIVSFKQNVRVINKTVNHYQVIEQDAEGKYAKHPVKQTKGDNWAVRKPLHKDTVSGLVELKLKKIISLSAALDNWHMIVNKDFKNELKRLVSLNYDKKRLSKYFKEKDNKWNDNDISRVEVYYLDSSNVASRVKIDESFNADNIKNITDTGIQKIMYNHLQKYNEHKNGKIVECPQLAFSADGVEEMNKNIQQLNDGKFHQSIFKVRTFEPKGNKFNVGQVGNKKAKYVEAAKGTNLFFAIYQDKKGKRSFETIPLNIVIERQKQYLSPVPVTNETGYNLLFHLSPNDLVYLPDKEEIENNRLINFLDKEKVKKIYKIVSFTNNRLYAIPNYIAKSIVDKVEFTQLNKLEFTFDKESIKETCIKLVVDRLGNITYAKTNPYNQSTIYQNNTFSEAGILYQKSTLQTFNSFEEENEGTAKTKASISPQQHLINVTERIKEMYADELKTPMDKTLKFRND